MRSYNALQGALQGIMNKL